VAANAFLGAIRELARCYQAFAAHSGRHVRQLGLTPSQFDIIATLGNTEAMSFRELGERTLITKGTLTGVIDRLTAKKLVRRLACPEDGRSQLVQLTAQGQALFERVFPAHVEHVRGALQGIGEEELQQAEAVLQRLGERFRSGSSAAD
jgi:DNA-binding MarR family transcriptional regulator